MVNYNSAPDLALCARSLMESREIPSLFVVDNASKEGGLDEAVAGYPEVVVIRSPENLGFGRGNNLGLRRALAETGCEFFFLLNNDATVEPDAIEKLEATLDAFPEAGMAAARITLSEAPDVLWYGGGHVDWRKGSPAIPGYLGPADSGLALEAKNVPFASGCAVMVRRCALEETGGFDPRLFMYQEDLELCLRTQRAGWTIRYAPDALVRHKGQGSERKDAGESFVPILSPKNPRLPFYAFHVMKGRLLTMFLHARGMNAARFLAWFPQYVAYKCLQYARHGRRDGIRAMLSGAREFAAVARQPFVDELKKDGR